MDVAAILNDLNAAERAYERVKPEMDALSPSDFTSMNLDVIGGTSTVLGVVDRIVEYRDQLAELPNFDVGCVDNIIDYATAAWYVFITNLADAKPEQFDALMAECVALRAKLLMWAEPLISEGHFDEDAIAKIKEGSGYKDVPSDVVALVGLYRSKWEAVEDQCAVTEADLDRGAQIGPYLFAMVSQREHSQSRGPGQDSRRVRAAWTLVDRAYDQCRRGLTFLLWKEDEVSRIAPSLRRNPGTKPSKPNNLVEPVVQVAPAPPAGNGATVVGSGDGPFAPSGE